MTERNLLFVIADKQGRPTMRTRRQSMAEFMEDQGWTVVDIIADPSPLPTRFAPRARVMATRVDARDNCAPGLRLGYL